MVDPLQAAARMHVLVVHDLVRLRTGAQGTAAASMRRATSSLVSVLRPALDQLVDGGEVLDARASG